MTGRFFKSLALAAIAAVGLTMATPAVAQTLHAQCDAYARDVAARYGNPGNVVGGTVAGAATGAIIGGIIDGGRGAGAGALIGGGAGLAGSAAVNSARWNEAYNAAYNDCVARNTRAPARRTGGLEPWSPAWFDYCRSKYRSFNPQTGYYTTYSGNQRFCQ